MGVQSWLRKGWPRRGRVTTAFQAGLYAFVGAGAAFAVRLLAGYLDSITLAVVSTIAAIFFVLWGIWATLVLPNR